LSDHLPKDQIHRTNNRHGKVHKYTIPHKTDATRCAEPGADGTAVAAIGAVARDNRIEERQSISIGESVETWDEGRGREWTLGVNRGNKRDIVN
jgi:hypothetical protein